MKLTRFDEADFVRYPFVETHCAELAPRLARVKIKTPGFEGLPATLIVDGNGIQVTIYDEDGHEHMVFCRELHPFPLALFLAEHLEEPLDLEVLTRFGFERFK